MSLFVSKETLQDWEGGKRNLILRLFEREEYGVRPRACGKKLTYVRCDQRLFGTFAEKKCRCCTTIIRWIFTSLCPSSLTNRCEFSFVPCTLPRTKTRIFGVIRDCAEIFVRGKRNRRRMGGSRR